MELSEKIALAALVLNSGVLPILWWGARWVWKAEQRIRRLEYAAGINEPVS